MKYFTSIFARIGLLLGSYVPASYLFMGRLFLFHVFAAPPYGLSATELLEPLALAPITAFEVLLMNVRMAQKGLNNWYVFVGFFLLWLLSFAGLFALMRRRSHESNVA